MATKKSSDRAAKIAGKVVRGGTYTDKEVKTLAASVLAQAENDHAKKGPQTLGEMVDAAIAAAAEGRKLVAVAPVKRKASRFHYGGN